MKLFKKVLLVLMLMPGAALAATELTPPAATGNATTTITLTIANHLVVTAITDVALGTYGGTGALAGSTNLCIGSTKNPSAFRITPTGSGASSAFTVASGANTIAYSASYYPQANLGGTAVALAPTTQTVDLTTSTRRTIGACMGGSAAANANGSIGVSFTEAALQAATAGAYSGVLTLQFDAI